MVRRETSSPQQMQLETEKDGLDLPALQGHTPQDPNRKNPIFDPALMTEHDKLVNMLNPDPLPYQVQRFKSCTALKFVDVPRRHHESFGRTTSSNEPLSRSKAIIMHTERFAWDAKPQENITQRDRLTSEQNHVEVAKVMKRRGDVLAHRERHELLLGGEKLPIQDRDMTSRDINEAYRSQFSGPALVPVPQSRPEPRAPEVSMQPKDAGSPEANKENAQNPALWEPERHTFDNQFNTVSMGVHRAQLHARDNREPAAVSPPGPPPARRPSQVPRLPRLPNAPNMTATGEMDGVLGTARPIGHGKRRGITEMMMGGNRVSLNERADIQSELRRLKSVPLPQTCRELYIGRGIKLPPNHATIKPRLPPPSAEPAAPAPVPSFVAPESQPAGIQGLRTKSGAPVHISPADNGPSSGNPEAPAQDAPEQDPAAKEPEPEVTEPLSAADQAVLDKEPADPLQPERRPGSTPLPSQTPNPLKGALFKSIPDFDEDNLMETFKRLDTDMDGHVSFSQMESEIPSNMTSCEKRFVKEIYDIVSASTFFGSKEFALIKLFCRKVESLHKELRDAFEETRDIDLHDSIVKFDEQFQSVDRSNKGEISCESLKNILATLLEKDLNEDAKDLQITLDKIGLKADEMIGKLDFLSYVPFFLSQEPSLKKQFVADRAKTILE